MIVLDRG
ncbi:hypothetical protein D043_2941A, partial [Vibrio parahaemolyticus EKP-021]